LFAPTQKQRIGTYDDRVAVIAAGGLTMPLALRR